jgi:hypothetical protein
MFRDRFGIKIAKSSQKYLYSLKMKSTGISREGPIYDLFGNPLFQHSQDPDGILPESWVIAYDLKLLFCLADIPGFQIA